VARTGLEVFLAGLKAGQQSPGGGADRVHRLVERLFVGRAGEANTTHRPHVLERGRLHVVVGYADGIRRAQGFDIAAHGTTLRHGKPIAAAQSGKSSPSRA
jgi:hypothetical protein